MPLCDFLELVGRRDDAERQPGELDQHASRRRVDLILAMRPPNAAGSRTSSPSVNRGRWRGARFFYTAKRAENVIDQVAGAVVGHIRVS